MTIAMQYGISYNEFLCIDPRKLNAVLIAKNKAKDTEYNTIINIIDIASSAIASKVWGGTIKLPELKNEYDVFDEIANQAKELNIPKEVAIKAFLQSLQGGEKK